MNDKIKSILGFAMKAGAISSGEVGSMSQVKKKSAYLVILAVDASQNTKKLFGDKTTFRNIPLRIIGSKEELGKAIGKLPRAVVAVLDKGFAAKLIQVIDQEGYRG
ncbi:L7Ae/L30e/S12e/Gadd45 family ribosomal protein [Alkaliphilus peptidifermentans]|uniref:Ribosomal protein L7Ae n=1 Tax=Alkaliphilus peptidifermentans DSM 18978 TaxID=1120976 RepID=A0A1G5DD49_9FIRM|nr:ribosomal L7Ae/L30e/S12e/Gadd45 family protein [Alkaliphilus peptidifermentans]SCY12487.1 Ribosomal protein L7Ae [Alkaliphilus peptidifermentans DSM 18978]